MNVMYLHTNSPCSLQWMEGEKILYELACMLKEKGYIKSLREFYKLFDERCPDYYTRWKAEKFALLAYLLHILHENNIFITTGNKGYFSFAEKHIVDFKGNKLKKDLLKNLCTRVKAEEIRFALVRAEVDKIIKDILNKKNLAIVKL